MKDNFDEKDDFTVYSTQINTAVFFQASKIDLPEDENEKSGINEVFSKKMIKIASAKVEIAAPGDK